MAYPHHEVQIRIRRVAIEEMIAKGRSTGEHPSLMPEVLKQIREKLCGHKHQPSTDTPGVVEGKCYYCGGDPKVDKGDRPPWRKF